MNYQEARQLSDKTGWHMIKCMVIKCEEDALEESIARVRFGEVDIRANKAAALALNART